MTRSLASALVLFVLSGQVCADAVRLAVFNVELQRDGPGLLLRDVQSGKDPQVNLTAGIIRTAHPDVILLLGFDHDAEGRTIAAYRDNLAQGAGSSALSYPYIYSPAQNAGVDSGHDLDGDGLLRGPADAFGYGEFRGHGGMALLSRFPLRAPQDFSKTLWRDLPDADLPVHADGTPYPSGPARQIMRLSLHGHWDVAVDLPDGRRIHVLASYSSPPVFDGPEDINGKRNHDELLFWDQYLAGHGFVNQTGQTATFSGEDYALLAGLNADPVDGDGAGDLFQDMVARNVFTDPKPDSRGARAASVAQGGVNRQHRGDAAQDTADWRDEVQPGNLRVDYALPSPALTVLDSGVIWPTDGEPLYSEVTEAQVLGTRHRLVWIDIE